MLKFFISDTHFGHKNIIKYSNRPFKSIEEMDNILISNWNKRVKKEDTVFHIGDFCFGKSTEAPNSKGFKYYKEQLNGNIIFIKGSHDKNNLNKTVVRNLVIELGGMNIFLVHDPENCDINYEFNIVGHVHDKWKFKRFRRGFSFTDCCNVSVEQWNYQPVTIVEIFQELAKWRKENGFTSH